MLSSLFNPRSIAVIGASNEPGKVGNAVLQNLVKYGYQGTLFPVNPSPEPSTALLLGAGLLGLGALGRRRV